MKHIKRVLCIILVFTFIFTFSDVIVAKAVEGKFIAIDFESSVDEYSEKIYTTEILYTDGEYLYASTDLLAEYTAYNYDSKNNAFVRSGQEFNFSLSKTTIDYANKKATVQMMGSTKEYTLHNIYKFGSTYYLPLDQLAGFLKAKVEIREDYITLLNSGYSIADAAYNFSEYKYVLQYNDILDKIFVGNEKLYYSYCVLSFFGSTIFDLRIKNLDIIGHSGDVDYYKDALAASVTDNSEYLKTQQDEDTFTKRLSNASEFTKTATEINKTLKNTTTVVKNYYETFTDTNDIANLDLEYIEAKNWSEVFGMLDKSYSYIDYFIKALAMTQDHKKMLNDCYKNNESLNKQFITALASINNKYGKDLFSGMAQQIGDTLIKELPENAIKEYAADVVPYLAVIKGVKAFFKLCGVDLGDNLSYSILIDSDTAYELTNKYFRLKDQTGKTKADSEKARCAGIFMLLTMKHAYESGNKLNKKVGGTSSLFNDEIDYVCARLNLFYRAVESSSCDSIEGIENLVSKNEKIVKNNSIISTAKETTDPTVFYAAIELIYNLPKYGFDTSDYATGIELIDLDYDKIPEVAVCCYMGATMIPSLQDVFYFDGTKYVKGSCDGGIFPIVPRTNSNKPMFTSYLRDEFDDYYQNNYPGFSSYWYYYGREVYQYTYKNGKLTTKPIMDFSNYQSDIQDDELDENAKMTSWKEYMGKVIDFNQSNPYNDDYQYGVKSAIEIGMIDSNLTTKEKLELYHETMTKGFARGIVSYYMFNDISGEIPDGCY